jgi:hypothetical protein
MSRVTLEDVVEASPLNWLPHLAACLLFGYLLLAVPLHTGTDLWTTLTAWLNDLRNAPARPPR